MARRRNKSNVFWKASPPRGLLFGANPPRGTLPEDCFVAIVLFGASPPRGLLFGARLGQMFLRFEVSLANLVAKVLSMTLSQLKLGEL